MLEAKRRLALLRERRPFARHGGLPLNRFGRPALKIDLAESEQGTDTAPLFIVCTSAFFASITYLSREVFPDAVLSMPDLAALAISIPVLGFVGLRRLMPVFVTMAAMILYYFFRATIDTTSVSGSLRTVVQVMFAFSCFFVGLAHRMKRRATAQRTFLLSLIPAILLTLLVLVKPASGEDLPKNVVGGVTLYLSAIAATAWRVQRGTHRSMMLFPILIMILGTLVGQRLVAGVGALLVPVYWLGRSRKLAMPLQFVLPILGVVTMVVSLIMYTDPGRIAFFASLNDTVQKASGRQILSGREQIWGPVLIYALRHPWLGCGLTVTADDVIGLGVSAHNAFLNIFLQAGLFGLISIAFVFIGLLTVGVRSRNELGFFLSSVVTVVIIHNTYETTLIQNNFTVASLAWLSLGMIARQAVTPVHIDELQDEIVLPAAFRRHMPRLGLSGVRKGFRIERASP